MTLGEKVELLNEMSNEVAFTWNDSGCFWTFYYGGRGTSGLIDACIAGSIHACDADTFEEAVDEFLTHLVSLPGLVSADWHAKATKAIHSTIKN